MESATDQTEEGSPRTAWPTSHAELCSILEEIAPGWLAARFEETDVIAALPRFHNEDDGLRPIWCAALAVDLSKVETDAEQMLSRFCAGTGRLGLGRSKLVEFRLEPAPPLSEAQLQRLGMDAGYFLGSRGQEAISYADDIHDRTIGAAGWMICQREFREQHDALRCQWQALASKHRPPLPLERVPRLATSPDGALRAGDSRTTAFWRNFNEFCDRWRLLGMVTWDLPNPDGPKWTEIVPGHPQLLEGQQLIDTPWHFPVEGKDGLGAILEGQHERQAAEHGFTEQSRWKMFSQLLKIDFWERAMRSRYTGRPRHRDEVKRLVGVLAELIGCDDERVKKLRKLLHSYQSGRRTSLGEVR